MIKSKLILPENCSYFNNIILKGKSYEALGDAYFLNNDKNAFNEYEKMKFYGDNKKEVLEDCLKYKSKYNY